MLPPDPSGAAGDGPSRHLDLIAEMMAAFARSQDVEATLRLGLVRAVERLEAEAGSLFLLEPDGSLRCRASVGPVDVTGLRLAPGTGIVWRTVEANCPQRVGDTGRDPDFAPTIDDATGFITRSILCAPVAAGPERLGAIELFNKRGGHPFSDADLGLLQALTASAALAMINARLLASLAEQEMMQRDLELAAEIQRAMLPPLQGEDSPVHGVNLPARGVSGDFYEIVPLPDGRIAFAIGDVAGKGMKAALLMARTASLFRCLVKREDGPGRVLAAIESELHETRLAGTFVTMVAGLLDVDTGRVVLANAGHEPPVLYAKGRFVEIEGGMPPLGIDPRLFADGVPETVVDLDGGALYLFTDGLTEARGVVGGVMLGAAGVLGLLDAFTAMSAAERLQTVLHALGGAVTLRDDVTLMVVEDRTRPPSSAVQRLFPARPEVLAEIRATVAAALAGIGGGAEVVEACVLATDEACQNIIRHAYKGGEGDIVLHVSREDDSVVIRLMDFAPPVDPSKIVSRPLDDVRPGGLGTHLMRSVMDTVGFRPPPMGIGNLLEMVKRIESP
ncbi:ATP-binding SpoIIE family protein phosphatase [Magnetospirillum molischianum]|nr:SpoIIE family protein phosphatase [Magnetospirillum molischianum]